MPFRADKIFANLPKYVANANHQQLKNSGIESPNISKTESKSDTSEHSDRYVEEPSSSCAHQIMEISETNALASPSSLNGSGEQTCENNANQAENPKDSVIPAESRVNSTITFQNSPPGSVYKEVVPCLDAASPSDENSASQRIFSQRIAGVKKKLALARHISAEDDLNPDGFDSDDSVADPDFNGTVENDIEENTDEDKKHNKRKRIRNPKAWKRNLERSKRHSGLEHLTTTNKTATKKNLKPACPDTCKLKCADNLPEEVRKQIHKQYWTDQKSIDMKRQYIASHVQQMTVKRRRERNNQREGKRQHSNKYIFEVDGRQTTVCKKFFLNTLSISQQTVDTAIAKKREGGLVSPDKRGKHVPSNKTPAEVRETVRNHIMQFPVYQSHYSRERSKRQYLGNHLNISRMYQLYVDYCKEREIPAENIAKEWVYADVFNYEFNYGFKNPDNDTCDDCDMLQLKLREAANEDARRSLQEKYDAHLKDAGDRYKLKAADKQHSREFQTKKVVMIDLQKCLPTPELFNSQSFYSLKLWTYNLVIHDSTLQKAYCMMWNESVAGRGGNEVASCILKWSEICDIPENVEDLTVWSDNCPSQNRNTLIVMCYFYLLKMKPNLKTINHKFLTKGHTHLEADVDHSLIERERKKVSQLKIVTPWDWQQVVRLCCTKKPFHVTGMETSDFLNFKSLCEGTTSPFVVRKKNDNGDNFLISQVVHFQVRRNTPGVLFYKTKFSDEFPSCTLNRNVRKNNQLPESLPQIRNNLRKISTKKYNHLQKLLKWIPRQFHKYYQDLPHSNKTESDEEDD